MNICWSTLPVDWGVETIDEEGTIMVLVVGVIPEEKAIIPEF